MLDNYLYLYRSLSLSTHILNYLYSYSSITYMAMGQNLWYHIWVVIHIHLPAILMFTRGTGFWPITISINPAVQPPRTINKGIFHGAENTDSIANLSHTGGSDFLMQKASIFLRSMVNTGDLVGGIPNPSENYESQFGLSFPIYGK